MLKSYVGQVCPFCVTKIVEGTDVLICSDCAKPHHSDCWMYNLNRCTTLRCKGTGQHPEFIINELDQETLNKTGQLSPSGFKPATNLRSNINKTGPLNENILNKGPRQVGLKPIGLPGRKYPASVNTKTNPVPDKKLENTLNFPQKAQRKIPVLNNNLPKKPDPFIPDYVHGEYVRQKNKPPPRRYYKPEVIEEIKKEDPGKYSAIPKPESFVPDYVNDKLKHVPGFTRGPNVGSRPVFKSPFRFSKIPEKPKERNKFDPVPKPAPFIPDYVYGELPAKSRRKIARSQKAPRYELPEIKENKPEIKEESVPRPEPFIPDYVFAELTGKTRSIFTGNIISTVRCPSCSKTNEADSKYCSYCKALLNETGKNDEAEINTGSTSQIKPEVVITGDLGNEYKTFFVNAKKIQSVVFSPDGRLISFGSNEKSVKVIDLETKQCLKTFNEHSEGINAVCFSPDGQFISSGSSDKTVKIWDLSSGMCYRTIKGNQMGIEALVYSPDGKYVVSGSGYGTIKVWDIKSQICITTLETASPSWLNSISYSPAGHFIASGNSEPMVNIWDVSLGYCLKEYRGHFDFVNSVAYSPDGLFLVSGSNDRTLKLWDITEDKCLLTFSGHQDNINSVAYRADSRYVVSGSSDRTIKIWDVHSGNCIRTINGHTEKVNSVAFSADGRYIASGSDDKTIKIWQV